MWSALMISQLDPHEALDTDTRPSLGPSAFSSATAVAYSAGDISAVGSAPAYDRYCAPS